MHACRVFSMYCLSCTHVCTCCSVCSDIYSSYCTYVCACYSVVAFLHFVHLVAENPNPQRDVGISHPQHLQLQPCAQDEEGGPHTKRDAAKSSCPIEVGTVHTHARVLLLQWLLHNFDSNGVCAPCTYICTHV